MADPLSIAASCIAVITVASQTTNLIREFVRGYRNARADLARLNQEISDLDLVLQSIRDVESDGDFRRAGVPKKMQEHLIALLDNCNRVLTEIQAILTEHLGSARSVQWVLTGKRRVNDQEALLQGHRKALDLSLATIDFSLSCMIKADTAELLVGADESRAKLEEILQLVKLLPGAAESVHDVDTIQGRMEVMHRYLDSLSAYASSVYDSHTDSGGDRKETEFPDLDTQAETPNRQEDTDEPSFPGRSATPQSLSVRQGEPAHQGTDARRDNTKPDSEIDLPGLAPAKIATSASGGRRNTKVACAYGGKVTIWDNNAESWKVLSELKYERSRLFGFRTVPLRNISFSKLSFMGERGQYIAIETCHGKHAYIDVWDWALRKRIFPTWEKSAAWSPTTPWATSPYQISHPHFGGMGGNLIIGDFDGAGTTLAGRRLRSIKTGNIRDNLIYNDCIQTKKYDSGLPNAGLSTEQKTLLGVSGNGRRVFMATSTADSRYISIWRVDPNSRDSEAKVISTSPRAVPGYQCLAEPFHVAASGDGTEFVAVWKHEQETFDNALPRVIWDIDFGYKWSEWAVHSVYGFSTSKTFTQTDGSSGQLCVTSPDCSLLAMSDGDDQIFVKEIHRQRRDGDDNDFQARVVLRDLFTLHFNEARMVDQLEFSPCSRKLFCLYKDRGVIGMWDIEERVGLKRWERLNDLEEH